MIPLKDTVQARSFPFVNWMLISANVLVFFWVLSAGSHAEALVTALGVVPARLLSRPSLGEAGTLISGMFLHGGWMHLFSNMLALYIFGDNVEDRMGSGRYLVFYVLCGLAAALAHIFFNAGSTIPAIGASGAISGVLGAYLLLYPTARVITLIPILFLPWIVEIPAVFYLGVWFASQLLNATFSTLSGVQALGGVAWWAHVGGFVAGIVLVRLFLVNRPARRRYYDEYYPW